MVECNEATSDFNQAKFEIHGLRSMMLMARENLIRRKEAELANVTLEYNKVKKQDDEIHEFIQNRERY